MELDWILNTPWLLIYFKINLVNQISSERKVKMTFGVFNWWPHIFHRTCFEGPPGDVLRTCCGRPASVYQGRLLIRTSPGHHFRTSSGGQIRTCLGWSNRIFRDVLGTSSALPGDQYLLAGYIDSPNWIKKTAINPINEKENKSFQYAVTVALNHEELGKYSERITKTKSFIN